VSVPREFIAKRKEHTTEESTLGLAGLGSATVDVLAGLANPFALRPLPALRTSGASDFGIWDLHTSTGVRSITRRVALAPAHRGVFGLRRSGATLHMLGHTHRPLRNLLAGHAALAPAGHSRSASRCGRRGPATAAGPQAPRLPGALAGRGRGNDGGRPDRARCPSRAVDHGADGHRVAAATPGDWRPRPYLRRMPWSVITSNRPVSSRSKSAAR
jgi:hypothetical protein